MVAILDSLLTVTVAFILTHRRLEPQLLLHSFVLLLPDHSKDERGYLTKYRDVVSEYKKYTVVKRDSIDPKVGPFVRHLHKIENTSEQKR